MKKSVIFFAVIFSLLAISCDKEEAVEPEPEQPTVSIQHLMVFTDDENIDYCMFTMHLDPPTEGLINRSMIKRDGKFEYTFGVPLEIYGGQTVKVSIHASNCHEGPCKVYEDYQYVPIEGNDIDNPNEIIFEVGD
jgi:hypothetical protein